MDKLNNPIGWFEIHVSELARAAQFYEIVLQQKLSPLPSNDESIKMMVFSGDMGSPGATGALVQHPMKKPSTEGTLVYFSCDDCAQIEKLAIANNGKVFKTKFSIGFKGFISIIGDSEGNSIGLHSFQ